jgi:ArsR family transcriptional regulator
MTTYQEYAVVFKALADNKRLQILHMLADGEMCACKILECFHITQPTLSHHMKLLTDAQLVHARKEGKWIHYSIAESRWQEVDNFLVAMTKGGSLA